MDHCIEAHKRALGKWVVDNREIMPTLKLLFPITITDSDTLILMVPRHEYHGLIITLSHEHNNNPTMDLLREQGYLVPACTDWKAAAKWMLDYLQ